MAQLIEDTRGKIRDLPIIDRLKDILLGAAQDASIDIARVTSGGQAKIGTAGKRTGSTRHDLGNAADLVLERGDRRLDFTKSADLPFFEAFVAAAVRRGATGIGAGIGYMGPHTIHIGFGSEAVWGAKGKAANAPSWLKAAVARGKAAPASGAPPAGSTPTPQPSSGQYVVLARSGLRLRAGPGTEFASRAVLPKGSRLFAAIDPPGASWARVDLQGDGHVDGYVFAAYIAPA